MHHMNNDESIILNDKIMLPMLIYIEGKKIQISCVERNDIVVITTDSLDND